MFQSVINNNSRTIRLIAGLFIMFNILTTNTAIGAENFENVTIRGLDSHYLQSSLTLPQLKQSALAGDSRAQLIFGHALVHGKGIKKDAKSGLKWIEKAAEQGSDIAQFQLGLLLEYGQSIPANHQNAAKWHLKAAQQGNIGAQHSIGMMYLDGKGIEKNLVNAYAWTSLAYENGYEEIKQVRDHIKTQLNNNQQQQAQVRMQSFKNGTNLSEQLALANQ